MDIIGIICEYNPFHNGHIYHLKKVKELFPNSLIILVMSGNFTQRGIPSIINKWDKAEIALKYGIDLVVELPFVFATQGADIFAKGAISILNNLHAQYLVFGSETNDVDSLTSLANLTINNEDYNIKVKQYLKEGINYPTALNKALESFSNNSITTPNDLLGLSYIKEIIKTNSSIKPITIQRTNNYHEDELNNTISSATSIRNAYLKQENISEVVPIETIEKLKDLHFDQNQYFPFLKYKIETTNDLSIFQTVDEGIENRIKKYIHEVTAWEELIIKLKTKRYTYNKINRMLTHILCGFTKEEAKKYQDIEYIRILGFSNNGRGYLNKIKKEVTIPIITTFSKIKNDMLNFEFKTTCVYSSILSEDKKNKLIKSEYQTKPKTQDL